MTIDQHADDAPGHGGAVADHATDDQGEDHGLDDHGRDTEPLGPIDVAAWGAGALGLMLGLIVAICFALATSAPA